MCSSGIGSSGPNQRKVICIASRGSHDEVVDVAAGEARLLVIVVDACSDDLRCREIKWSALHRSQLTSRDERRIHGSEPRRGKLQRVVENVTHSGAGEIEVAVLSEIDR